MILLAFAAPSLILLLLINLYPLIYAGYQSLRDGSLISAGDFVGLENYQKVLTDPAFWARSPFHGDLHAWSAYSAAGWWVSHSPSC